MSIAGALLEQQPPFLGFGCVLGLELTLEGCVELPSALLGPEQHEPPVLVLVSDGGGAGFGVPFVFPEQQDPPFDAVIGVGVVVVCEVLTVDDTVFG